MTATSFKPAADGVDPAKVPFKTLPTGAKLPMIGLGTFGSDAVTGEQIAEAVVGAAAVGYRHFDYASVYGNEHLLGHSFRKIVSGGVRREDLWITSKLWNDKHAGKDVILSCEKSLKDLHLDYLDLYRTKYDNGHQGCMDGEQSERHLAGDSSRCLWRPQPQRG